MPLSNPFHISVQKPSSTARDRLIVALDFPDAVPALALVETLHDSVQWYKVGLELFLAGGHQVVEALVSSGKSVFLDLKLHDIPNTVAGAVHSAARSGASLLTIHAAGGPAMIQAATNAAAALTQPPRVLAVTVLTSMDQQQLEATGVPSSPAEQVQRLAAMALEAGADGLICSAEEAAALRSSFGPGPLLVTPGIRPSGSVIGDQKRVASPSSAIRAGASYLVVGRPITQAQQPARAVQSILAEMQSSLDTPV